MVFGTKTIERIATGLERLKVPREPRAKITSNSVAVEAAGPATGNVWAGTSGFSYPQWKGSFYPEDAKTAELLTHYAQRLRAVEINNTFYRFPSLKTIEQWMSQTPDEFRFAVKAHRRITHKLQLAPEAASTIVDFVSRCGELGNRLGCILFQLPPKFHRNDERLNFLLETLPAGPRYAIEFRHESWFEDEVLGCLRDKNVACVLGKELNKSSHRPLTADFTYIRLQETSLAPDTTVAWKTWFDELSAARKDVWVFVKHDDDGNAPKFMETHWATDRTARRRLEDALVNRGESAKSTGKRRKSG